MREIGVHELTCLDICAGAGGQSLGLEDAGFSHVAAVEIDPDACQTLRLNRQHAWKVIEGDVHQFDGRPCHGVGLLAGGVPCPPFSVAGRQLGADDERDLFPQALRLVRECEPAAVMLENVPGLSQAKFASYREHVLSELNDLGVDGRGLADAPPGLDTPVDHVPRLTLAMAAVIQGFPLNWKFSGRKTATYRQIGNAFPPPVARAVGTRIRIAIQTARELSERTAWVIPVPAAERLRRDSAP
jgi:site-specific DNA-cytosine methylase